MCYTPVGKTPPVAIMVLGSHGRGGATLARALTGFPSSGTLQVEIVPT